MTSKIISEKAAFFGKDSLTLCTRGRKKRIYLTEKKVDVSFSSENLHNYHTDTEYSAQQMNRLAKFIRHSAGRKSVPSNYSSHISERTKLLEDNYEISIFEFDTKNIKGKEKRRVIWTNAEKIVESVLEKRNFVDNYTIKVMADGGQGFLKVSMKINFVDLFDYLKISFLWRQPCHHVLVVDPGFKAKSGILNNRQFTCEIQIIKLKLIKILIQYINS